MRRVIAAILPLCMIAGCAHAPVKNEDGGPGHVAGVQQALDGIGDQALRDMVKTCVRQEKIFLYASRDTDSPVVEKGEVVFALQFKTAPVYSGFREALAFNAYMLEYIRGELKRGLCPEHCGMPLACKTSGSRKQVKGRKKHPGCGGEKVLVCPRDKREFVLYGRDPGAKTKVAYTNFQKP